MKETRLCPRVLLAVAALIGMAAPAAALEPAESLTTAHGLAIGPAVYEGQSPAMYVDVGGIHFRGAGCWTLSADGALTAATLSAAPLGPNPQLVLGPPDASPSIVSRDGSTIHVSLHPCLAQQPTVTSFDVSGPAFAGLTWSDFGTFAKFADGTVLYPALRNQRGGGILVALNPNDGSASVLVDAPDAAAAWGDGVFPLSDGVMGPDDRLWITATNATKSRQAFAAIARDGAIDTIISPQPDGTLRFGPPQVGASMFYMASIDAMMLGPVRSASDGWGDLAVYAVFPIANPAAGTGFRPPWVSASAIFRADQITSLQDVTAPLAGVIRGGAGTAFIHFRGVLRPFDVDPTVLDLDRDFLTLADEALAGTSDFDADTDGDWLVDGIDPNLEEPDAGYEPPIAIGPSIDIKEHPQIWDRGGLDSHVTDGGLLCDRQGIGNLNWRCVDPAGNEVVAGLSPSPAHVPGGNAIFSFDGDPFDAQEPAAGILRWDIATQTSSVFATFSETDTLLAQVIVALSDEACLVAFGATGAYTSLVRFTSDGGRFDVISSERDGCPLAGNTDDVATCDVRRDPVIDRVREAVATIQQRQLIRVRAIGFDPVGHAALVHVVGQPSYGFVIRVDSDGMTLALDGMDAGMGALRAAPDGTWYLNHGEIRDASLRRAGTFDQAAFSALLPFLYRGFLDFDRVEHVPIQRAVAPGEVIFWDSTDGGWALHRIAPNGGLTVWQTQQQFTAFLNAVALVSVEVAPLTAIDQMDASPNGNRLCLVERDAGRVWEIALQDGLITSVALITQEAGMGACSYDENNALAMVSRSTLYLPTEDRDIRLAGLQDPTDLDRVSDGWLVGDASTAARCFRDNGARRDLDHQILALAIPIDDVAVWVDPVGRVFAHRAENLCTAFDEEIEPIICPAGLDGCPGSTTPSKIAEGLAVRADGVMYWAGERIRLDYNSDFLPEVRTWFRPSEIYRTNVFSGHAEWGGGAVALPGGDFPPDYARIGEDGPPVTNPDPDPPADVADTSPDTSPDTVAEPEPEPRKSDDGCAGGCAGGGAEQGVLVLLLLAPLWWWRRRRVSARLLAVLAATLITPGCSDDAGGPGTVPPISGTAPTGGTGPANERPLWPLRPGLRLVRPTTVDVTVSANEDGRAITHAGTLGRTDHGWGRIDLPVTLDGIFVGATTGALLEIPDTVKLGTTWTSGPWIYEVTARDPGAETPLGPRTVWTISGANATQRFIEGVGPANVDFTGAYIPVEEQAFARPESPLMTLQPIDEGHAQRGRAYAVEALQTTEGLAITMKYEQWFFNQESFQWEIRRDIRCLRVWGVQGMTREWPIEPILQLPQDPALPLAATCYIKRVQDNPMSSTFIIDTLAPPANLWVGPNADVYFAKGWIFGLPFAFWPSDLRAAGNSASDFDSLTVPWEMRPLPTLLDVTVVSPNRHGGRFAGLLGERQIVITEHSVDENGLIGGLFVHRGRSMGMAFDYLSGEVTAPRVGPALVGTTSFRAADGLRDVFLTHKQDGVIDEVRFKDGEAYIERVGAITVPSGHTLEGVFRLGEDDRAGLLVVTAEIGPVVPPDTAPDRRVTWLWRAEIPDGHQPAAPPAPGLSVVARYSGLDVQVCWRESNQALNTDPTAWTLAGLPAAAVLAVPDSPECALILRDPAAWDADIATLEGPIPGVGRMLILPEARLELATDAIPVDGGAFVPGSGLATDGLLLPRQQLERMGTDAWQASNRVGIWRNRRTAQVPQSDVYFTLVKLDGSYVDSQVVVPLQPGNSLTLGVFADLADGGVLVQYRDGGAKADYRIEADGTTTLLDPPPLPGGYAMLTDGTVCGPYVNGMRCRDTDGTDRDIPIDWGEDWIGFERASRVWAILDGTMLVSHRAGFAIFDPATDEVAIERGPVPTGSIWLPDGAALITLDDGTYLANTATGLIPFTPPLTPVSAGAITRYIPLDEVDVVVTEKAVFRLLRSPSN